MPYSKISEILINTAKVLIVDDVPQNLQYLSLILREKEFQLSIALNGQQAINIANEIQPDLILLDIAMPGLDGFEVCKLLKSNPKTANIPIIFITAKTDFDTIAAAFEIGGVDYVSKPFNPKELILRIVNHLELKFHRDNLQKLNEQLINSNREKDRFLSLISHDIRSPFHGLLGISQILKENLDKLQTEDIREYIELLDEGLHNQYNFLNNIINWAKLRQGKMEFVPTRFAVKQLIVQLLKTLKINLEHKFIEVAVDIDPDTEIVADSNLLAVLFLNILSNSIKYTPKYGKVKLSASIADGQFTCTIADNGIGIEPKKLNAILNDGKVVSSLGTDSEEGSGLGLSLCKDIVALHNGELTIDSDTNSGTTVSFSIPT